jgi:hypothetical protein
MQLKDLRIELETYGDNKGKYSAKIQFEGVQGNITLKLAPETTDALLGFIGDHLAKFAGEAGQVLAAQVRQSIKEAAEKNNAH